MTKICAVVTSQNSVKTALAAGAEALEYRFDMFGEIPSELYFEKSAVCIAALRNCDDKEDFFRRALECGADFVDIEHDSEILGKFPKSKVICSYHDFEKTPSSEKIAEIFDELRKHGMPKAAFNVCSAADLMSIYNASVKLRAGKEPFILIGMGECGEITRIRSNILGSEFNYCAVSKELRSAPGQLLLSDAVCLRDSVVTGITGWPLDKTFSPKIHNAAFKESGIAGRYVKIPCRPEDLRLIPEIISAYKISGMNVTIPHKEKIIQYLSGISERSKAVGAVNTITEDLIGDNTDVIGIAAALNPYCKKDRKVLLIGAGGAARAAAYYLKGRRAKFRIADRTPEKAKSLADEFGAKTADINNLRPEYQIIINATPASFSQEIFSKGCIVMDMKYPSSEFLKKAEMLGACAVSGKSMLIHQAAESFFIWTGVHPDIDVMNDAFEDCI